MALCLEAKRALPLPIESHSLLLWEALTGCTVQLKHLSRAAGPSLMLAIPAQANGVCGEAVSHSVLCSTLLAANRGELHKLLWQYVCTDPTGSSVTPQDPVCLLSSRKQGSEQLQPFCARLGYSSVTGQEPPGSESLQGNTIQARLELVTAPGVPAARVTEPGRSASSLCRSLWGCASSSPKIWRSPVMQEIFLSLSPVPVTGMELFCG